MADLCGSDPDALVDGLLPAHGVARNFRTRKRLMPTPENFFRQSLTGMFVPL
jgi:hypothetical protein